MQPERHPCKGHPLSCVGAQLTRPPREAESGAQDAALAKWQAGQGRSADSRAARGAGDVTFNFNSELYADPGLAEGVDYARRHRRHERFDDTLARTDDVPKTTILAPHGGGIEPGTSELCLAVAGYHPANLPQIPPAGVTYDYWMFEGVRDSGNAELHVTATGCDDGVAVSLCAGSLNALALHGFQPGPPGMSEDDQVVLVGGGNAILRGDLLEGLREAGFDAQGRRPARGAQRRRQVQHRQPHPARHGRAAGAQHPVARCDVHRAHPLAAQAHHHPAVLDLRGGVPRRARPARSRADRGQARASMPRKKTVLNSC